MIVEFFVEGFFAIVSIVMGWIAGMWYAMVRLEKKIVRYIKKLLKKK